MVLFVTGLCDKNCYYCPLSKSRKGKDVVYADETPVKNDLDIILECRAIDAEGTGMTGGDPLIRAKRTLKYIRLLKREFGDGHHIHLYTNGMHAGKDLLTKLKEAGLDEIRFHPGREFWDRIAVAKALGMCAGAEAPSIPGGERELKEFIRYLENIKADFLNLNQLEFSPENALQLKQRGFALENGEMSAVKGSEEAALHVIKWAELEGISLPINYCPTYVKDSIQTKRRLLRRAKNVRRPYEEVFEDGLVGKVVVRTDTGSTRMLRKELHLHFAVPLYAIGISDDGGALELHRNFLDPARKLMRGAIFEYVQSYPTFSRDKFAGSPC
ncbi:MAG: radical SAM protein [Candidatus Methanosuratus sp.]|nr:radical SAM protein [Candidatus Methanosuratincola sp.]